MKELATSKLVIIRTFPPSLGEEATYELIRDAIELLKVEDVKVVGSLWESGPSHNNPTEKYINGQERNNWKDMYMKI